jgi:hypothetical protein
MKMSTTTYSLCPNCGEKIEGGFLHGCAPIDINGYKSDKTCDICGHWMRLHGEFIRDGITTVLCLVMDCSSCNTPQSVGDPELNERVRYWKRKLDE